MVVFSLWLRHLTLLLWLLWLLLLLLWIHTVLTWRCRESHLPKVTPHLSHTYFAFFFAWSLDGTTGGDNEHVWCSRDGVSWLSTWRRCSAYVSRTAPQWRHRCFFMKVVVLITERTRALSTPIYRAVHACVRGVVVDDKVCSDGIGYSYPLGTPLYSSIRSLQV